MKKSPEINPTSSVAKVASHEGVFRGVRFSSSPAIAKDDVPILDVSIVIYVVFFDLVIWGWISQTLRITESSAIFFSD